MNRRQFLRTVAGAGAAAAAGGLVHLLPGCRSASRPEGPLARRGDGPRKLIIVQFGGGTRSSEAIDDPDHRWIPHLWGEMVPAGTLFTNMRVEHRVVHPNSTGSIVTGHWEWDDLEWSRPVAHPTIFEVYRKARRAPDTAAWAFVYASILAKAGESLSPEYGSKFAANVVEPPTIPRTTAEKMDRLMAHAASLGSFEAELEAAGKVAALARKDSRIARGGLRSPQARRFLDEHYEKWKDGTGTTSHDAFLTDLAIAAMERFAPAVIAVCYGEIDCAHYGSWSRYTEAIRRTDELTWRVSQAADRLPEYRGRTLMLILPDHGRELDRPGGPGFIHHSDFYTNTGADEGCRRVWMLAVGPGVKAGRKIDRPTPITAAAATGLENLGLDASEGSAGSVFPALT
ncbi:MAG: twin-arginine translocation signal domain-containing protein [Planctomycetota bacterium]|jgi:hypothetical protein